MYSIGVGTCTRKMYLSLQWRNNGRDGVSNHQPHHCLLNRLSRRRSKKTAKLRFTGLCVGNSPVTGEFPTQMASNAENVSIWWRHHVCTLKVKNLTALTPVILKQEYSRRNRSISWLLMHWWRKEPGHQQPWCWLCNTNTCVPCLCLLGRISLLWPSDVTWRHGP